LNFKEDHQNNINNLRREIDEYKTQIEILTTSTGNQEMSINLNREKIIRLLSEIEIKTPKIDYHERQRELLLESFENLKMLQMSIFYSVFWERTFNNVQRVTLKFEQPLNSIFETKIFIMDKGEYEKHMNIIKQITSFKEFSEKKYPFLYSDGWDDHAYLTKVNINRGNNTVQIHVESAPDKKFVIICLTEVSVKNSPNERLVSSHFTQVIEQLKIDIKKANEDLKMTEDSIENDTKVLEYNKKTCGEFRSELINAETNLTTIKENRPKKLHSLGLELDQVQGKIVQMMGHRKFTLTDEISEIIQIMVINKSSYEKMRTIKDDFKKILNEIKSIKLTLLD
jgi:hypothetical protein